MPDKNTKITKMLFRNIPVAAAALLFLLSFCKQNNDQIQLRKKPAGNSEDIILNQDVKEFKKAGELKIKQRNTISYFYNNSGQRSERGTLVESVIYDERGNRIEHINFKSTGDVDLKWVYKYDENNNLIRSETYNIFDDLVGWSDIEYDENGIEISRREMNRSVKGITNVNYKFGKDGYLTDKITKDAQDNILTREKLEIDDAGYLIKKYVYDKNDKLMSEYNMQYDSLGNLINEEQVLEGYSRSDISYRYDSKGNLIVKDAGYYKQEFKYDSRGNIVEEDLYDKDGFRQQKFVYTYDQRDLLVDKVRYDSEDRPFLFVKYEYEFY